MKSFPISVNLPDEQRTRKLIRKCGEVSFICYFKLMSFTASNHPSGYLRGMDEDDIELKAGWDGDAGLLIRTMLDVGFLEKHSDCYFIAGWVEEFESIKRLDIPITLWKKIRQRVFERDNHTCVYCGIKPHKLECDHVYPLSRGGKSTMNNLVAACQECNRAKRNKTPEEWKGK